MSRRTALATSSLLLALALALSAVPAGATTVVPVLVPGNPSCADLGFAVSSFKVDPPAAGTYTIDGHNTITVEISGPYVSWSSTIPIDRVVVKGGPNANVYIYEPEASSDGGLVTPTNPSNGEPYGLSHLDFCFDYEVRVSKTAIPAYTRTFTWEIDKTASPKSLAMFRGDTGSVTYGVAVTRFAEDSGHAVAGAIAIENPSPFTAEIASVTDVLSNGTAAAVTCPAETIAPFTTMTCTYATTLADASTLTNTATVTTTGLVGGGTGTAPVVFGAPTAIVGFPSVHVTDTNGMSWTADGTSQWTYARSFTCDRDGGGHDNTAAIAETSQSDAEHVDVACYGLVVAKTAATELDRTWSWKVAKTAAEPALKLSTGQQYLATYTVTVGATSADSAWGATGTITVTNPAPIPATLEAVTDTLPGSTAAVDCGVPLPHLLAPGASLVCGWSSDLPDATARVNTAEAILANVPSGTTGFSATAAVVFDGATTVRPVDACATLEDSYEGSGLPDQVCIAGGPSQTFTYTRPIGPYDLCGSYSVDNVATVEGKDTGTSGNAAAQVSVTVPCATGCTLTPGYWKTHSVYGPARYDEAWALLGEDTPFFQSGQAYYQVLWTSPSGGNAFYILAHAWIAAKLNGLNEASVPQDVADAFAAAEAILAAYTPAGMATMKGKTGTALRAEALGYAWLLDQYNNGLAAGGPPHCSE